MTEEDVHSALFALGSKYPAWALVSTSEGIRTLMTDKGQAYIKEYLPDWVPPSQKTKENDNA